MVLQRLETGLVSADRALLDFYADVLDVEELEPIVFPGGTVYVLGVPGGLLKVMVPDAPPAPAARDQAFSAVTGIRYLTLRVDDLDALVERATARGATVLVSAFDLRPGARLAMLVDPDGNTFEAVEAVEEASVNVSATTE